MTNQLIGGQLAVLDLQFSGGGADRLGNHMCGEQSGGDHAAHKAGLAGGDIHGCLVLPFGGDRYLM